MAHLSLRWGYGQRSKLKHHLKAALDPWAAALEPAILCHHGVVSSHVRLIQFWLQGNFEGMVLQQPGENEDADN